MSSNTKSRRRSLPWSIFSKNRNKPDRSKPRSKKIELLNGSKKDAHEKEETPTCFVVDCLFLCELIDRLTYTDKESATYVSGIQLGNDRILTRIIPVDLDSSSPIHADANPASCAEVMIRLVDADLPLVAMAHSHPGTNPWSTRPSGIDLRYLRTLEKNAAKVIGVIVNRGCFVRFFSGGMPFDIQIQGNEFKRVDDTHHVYHLAPPRLPV